MAVEAMRLAARIDGVKRMRAETARPVSRALLPQWLARMLAFAALGAIGALEWQRLIGGFASARALLWVAVGAAAGGGALLAGRVRGGWLRIAALVAVTLAGLFVAFAMSHAGMDELKPRHWDELLSGLGGGIQALGTVRIPYVSADPWPRIALEFLGCALLVLAALLTFWPRAGAEPLAARSPLRSPDRGYPFVALAVLFVLVVSPIASLGGTRPVILGLALAALTVCFLWLERLPLRPGLGVAALLAIALVGALPLAAAADRGEPWVDYRAFAESLGPDDPVQFSWTQSYGPITWPRDGNEVLRVSSPQPLYWKARNLDIFDNTAWTARPARTTPLSGTPWEPDVPENWTDRPGWTQDISVSIRRMRTTDVIGAGTIMGVKDSSSPVRAGASAGTWDSITPLHRGDSYTVKTYSARPDPALLESATSDDRGTPLGELVITIPFKPGKHAPLDIYDREAAQRVTEVNAHFKSYSGNGSSYGEYPQLGRSETNIDHVMGRSMYSRTWQLSKQLKRGTKTPYEYLERVNAYLRQPEFRYSERPAQPPAGIAPLEYFLLDSHEGYCQHYAGAMALLLRMGGVPARVATGFTPGGYSAHRKAWIVRDTDAHAWVEAWFDRYGWITVDPTPDASPARSQIAAISLPATAAPLAPDRAGATDSTDTSAGDKVRVRPDLLLGTAGSSNGSSAGDGGPAWWVFFLALLGVGLAALVIALIIRRPRGATPMDRAIAELEDAMRRVGRPVSAGTTLSQLERRLGSHSPEVAAYLRALAAGRYAPGAGPPPRSGRRALRRALAQGLGFGRRTRALWALPPRLERGARRPRPPATFELDTSVRR